MIDLHCHFLPGIDDGAQTMAEGLALARASVDDGIVHSVMTPHCHEGLFENRKSGIEQAAVAFRESLAQHQIPLSISIAAEARIGSELVDLLTEDQVPFLGTLGTYKVLLLEFPHGHIPIGADRFVSWLISKGIRPMIAHPERNKDVLRRLEKMQPFIEAGALLQITAGSLTGHFGPTAKRRAFEMVEKDWVFAVATDAHNLDHRPPDLSSARTVVTVMGGAILADTLTLGNPRILLGKGTGFPRPTERKSTGPRA